MRVRASSRSKAFMTFDGLFSIVPALVILLFTMNAAHFLSQSSAERMHEQQQFDKLVSIADHVVKQGAAMTGVIGDEKVRYPNWIEESRLPSLETDLKGRSGLNSLSIRLRDPGGGSVCIYRIVLDDSGQITKLYVCGD